MQNSSDQDHKYVNSNQTLDIQ